MAVAVVGAIAAVLGACIGAVAATLNARRSDRVQLQLARVAAAQARTEQLSSLALSMAKLELERNPDNPHSVAAHFKVLETLLHENDGVHDQVDLEDVRDNLNTGYAGLCEEVGASLFRLEIARAIGDSYCQICSMALPGGQTTCPNCEPTVAKQG